MILIVDNVISDDESDLLISEFETRKSTKERSRKVDSLDSQEINSDIVTLNPNTETHKIVNDKTNIMVGHYRDYIEKFGCFDTHGLISRLAFSHLYRIIKYDIGQSIHDHVDKTSYVHGSCSLSLSDDYEGGEYRFFKGEHKVKLKKGQGMIWPADYFFVHGVDEITKGCKYTVNSFLGDIFCVQNPGKTGSIVDLFGTLRNEIVVQSQTAGFHYHKSSEESIKVVWASTATKKEK